MKNILIKPGTKKIFYENTMFILVAGMYHSRIRAITGKSKAGKKRFSAKNFKNGGLERKEILREMKDYD